VSYIYSRASVCVSVSVCNCAGTSSYECVCVCVCVRVCVGGIIYISKKVSQRVCEGINGTCMFVLFKSRCLVCVGAGWEFLRFVLHSGECIIQRSRKD